MTAIAMRPVLPQMPIILLVTGGALLRHLHRPGRIAMAVRTFELGVRAEQWEMGFPGVIEAPQRPAIG